MTLKVETVVNLNCKDDICIADFLVINQSYYVLDKFNHNIKVFDHKGQLLNVIGSQGSGEGEFYYPSAMALDRDKRIFIADSYNHRIQVLSGKGDFLYSFGQLGSGEGEFCEPADVAVDLDNNLLVIDGNNHRVKKFTLDGVEILNFGKQGVEPGCLKYPISLTVDEENNYYIIDAGNSRIQKFDSDGNYILGFGEKGDEQHQICRASGLLRYKDFIYVSDELGNKVLKYTKQGFFIQVFNQQMPGVIRLSNNGVFVVNNGTEITQLMDLDNKSEREFVENNKNHINKNIRDEIAAKCAFQNKDYKNAMNYVDKLHSFSHSADFGANFEILDYLFTNRYYDKAFSLIRAEFVNDNYFKSDYYDYLIKKRDLTNDNFLKMAITKALNENYIQLDFVIGKHGLGELNNPKKMAMDLDGNIYVTEHGSHRFQKFSYHGDSLMKVGCFGSKEEEFNSPAGICVNADGDIFVCDYENQRVQVFDKQGHYKLSIDHSLEGPEEITIDTKGRLVVSDIKANELKLFSQTGEYLGKWDISGLPLSCVPFQLLIMQDSNTKWFVSNKDNMVIKETKNGDIIKFKGSSPDYFNHLYSIAIDLDNYIYVSDYGRIQKFDKDFNQIYSYKLNISNPVSIKLFRDKLLVSDIYNNCIYCFKVRH